MVAVAPGQGGIVGMNMQTPGMVPAAGAGGAMGGAVPGVSSGQAGPRKPVSLYVANLAQETNQGDLDRLFRNFGSL